MITYVLFDLEKYENFKSLCICFKNKFVHVKVRIYIAINGRSTRGCSIQIQNFGIIVIIYNLKKILGT